MRLKRKLNAILLATILVLSALPGQAWAGTGAIYITPASSGLAAGASETLSLRITPGTKVDGVQATVSYNSGALQLNSVDTSASPFDVQLQKSVGGGVITLALGNLSGGVSSDSLIANMNFTALAASGSASLVLSNANATSGGSYTNPSSSGATITLGAGAGGFGGGSGSSGSSRVAAGGVARANPLDSTTQTSGAPVVSVTAPTAIAAASNLKADLVDKGMHSATLSVSSLQSMSLYVVYGTAPGKLTSKTSVESGKTASFTLSHLTPGTDYYYQVVGQDAAGSQAKLSVGHFQTAGFMVHVTVLDSRSQPVVNTQVSLHSTLQTAKTDGHGVATFIQVSPGLHHIEYTADGHTYSAPVYVQDQNNTEQATAALLPVEIPVPNGAAAALGVFVALIIFYIAVEMIRHRGGLRRFSRKLRAAKHAFKL
ncbi:MAG TPA: hypothetical protein VLG27_04700 [Candidatus Saccharimonadia bacterium]|nr:hypothetical protein [Candidatus Saccharimonadia bacterium]